MQHTKNTEKFLHLLKRYKKGICSPGEVKELFDLVKCGENNAELDDALRNDFNLLLPQQLPLF